MATSRVFEGCRALMAAARGASTAASTATKFAKGGGGGALSKALRVSVPLAKFLGASEASRTGTVKKVWEYIKLHNLQPEKGRKRKPNSCYKFQVVGGEFMELCPDDFAHRIYGLVCWTVSPNCSTEEKVGMANFQYIKTHQKAF